ncbi:MAG TPA: hypothetical protein VLQ93_14780 [Myxococcaceae bacterium]|nr:hypothetical protein [Myxococcaceae bacterium]
MRLRPLWLSVIFFALAGCENEEVLPAEPQLMVDRDSLGFGLEFDSSTYVGTEVTESLYIENRGQQPLEITSVEKTGASQFTLTLPEPLDQGQPLQLESRQHTFIQVAFKPTQARDYQGQLLIKSNAANTPEKTIELSGRGVSP